MLARRTLARQGTILFDLDGEKLRLDLRLGAARGLHRPLLLRVRALARQGTVVFDIPTSTFSDVRSYRP